MPFANARLGGGFDDQSGEKILADQAQEAVFGQFQAAAGLLRHHVGGGGRVPEQADLAAKIAGPECRPRRAALADVELAFIHVEERIVGLVLADDDVARLAFRKGKLR